MIPSCSAAQGVRQKRPMWQATAAKLDAWGTAFNPDCSHLVRARATVFHFALPGYIRHGYRIG